MKWSEFLVKISQLKAKGGKLGFNIGVVTRLIFTGAFNSMLTPGDEYMKMPAFERYQRMTKEAATAMKSKAKLPGKSKTEAIGIDEIRNDAGLVLWRHIVNPLFQFNLASLYKDHLHKTMGFRPSQNGNVRMIPMVLNLPDKPGCDLWTRWEDVYSQTQNFHTYKAGTRMAAVMGIITKTDKMVMKNGRVALRVFFFDGFKEWEIKLWPERDKETYSPGKAAYLKPCTSGLLVIKPDVYNGTKTGNLIHFYDMNV